MCTMDVTLILDPAALSGVITHFNKSQITPLNQERTFLEGKALCRERPANLLMQAKFCTGGDKIRQANLRTAFRGDLLSHALMTGQAEFRHGQGIPHLESLSKSQTLH